MIFKNALNTEKENYLCLFLRDHYYVPGSCSVSLVHGIFERYSLMTEIQLRRKRSCRCASQPFSAGTKQQS